MKKVFMILVWVSAMLCFFAFSVFSTDRSMERNRTDTNNRLALVIGNGAYKSNPLENPVNDARAMKDALESIGFKVMGRENIGYQAMNEVILKFGEELLAKGGVGLFYYAGHGIQYEGANYLIPVDADIQHEKQVKFRAVSAGSVLAEMENARNGVNIVILDACRDNPFSRSFRTAEKGLASLDAPVGTVIAYATSPGKTASDGSGTRNGLYTSELLRQMKIPNQRLVDVFDNTRKAVRTRTGGKQIPWESRSLEGAFYLVSSGKPSGSSEIIADSGGAFITEPAKETSLTIKPYPSDADVWINNKKIGRGKQHFSRIQPGWYQVKVTKDGYETYDKPVNVVKGEAGEVPVYLEKTEAPVIAPLPSSSVSQETQRGKITNSIGMEFVYIEPGSFMMGSPANEPGRYDNEKQHKVTLTKGFYMQTTEVTQGQWKAVMGSNPSHFSSCGNDCPVEQVSWNDTQEFIKKLNRKEGKDYRLPTEAEWEYAARAGGTTAYSWGNKADCSKMMYENDVGSSEDKCVDYVRRKGLTPDSTAPVMSYSSNDWGLYDMHGNVWEWCSDWYGDYPAGTVTDPAGAGTGSYRVLRGGSWVNYARNCRSADRSRDSPGNRGSNYGFRLVLPAGQQR